MADAFLLKFQRNNQQNVLAVDSAKGETGEKGCIFSTVEMKQLRTMIGPRSCRQLDIIY